GRLLPAETHIDENIHLSRRHQRRVTRAAASQNSDGYHSNSMWSAKRKVLPGVLCTPDPAPRRRAKLCVLHSTLMGLHFDHPPAHRQAVQIAQDRQAEVLIVKNTVGQVAHGPQADAFDLADRLGDRGLTLEI